MAVILKPNTYNGKLIVFEGTDGSGKTTLISKSYCYLSQLYGEENIILTKQPTDMSRKTKLFQKMMYCKNNKDIDYRAVQLLTLSDRVQHNYEVIEPALREGKIIICDRYIYTSIANMLARGYTKEEWFFDACKNIIRPDLVFLTYINPDKAIERIKKRPEECMRHLNENLLKKVVLQFLRLKDEEGFNLIETDNEPEITFKKIENIYNQKWRNMYEKRA